MGGKAWHIRTKAGSVGMKNSLNLSPGSTVKGNITNNKVKEKESFVSHAHQVACKHVDSLLTPYPTCQAQVLHF